MASPQASFDVSSPALDQWRPNGDRLSYKDVGWCGAALGIVMHAALNFFSVAIPSLERLLAVFGPPERLAFGLTEGANPLATWMLLLLAVAAWGAFAGIALLALVHEATDLVRRALHRQEAPPAE
jgi:hypothetical protein